MSARRSDTMRVAIRVTMRQHPDVFEAIAKTRVTPWGSFEVSCYDKDRHVARRLAQAQILFALHRAILTCIPNFPTYDW